MRRLHVCGQTLTRARLVGTVNVPKSIQALKVKCVISATPSGTEIMMVS